MTEQEQAAANDLAEVVWRTRALLVTLLNETPESLRSSVRNKVIGRKLDEIREVLDAAEDVGISPNEKTHRKVYGVFPDIW